MKIATCSPSYACDDNNGEKKKKKRINSERLASNHLYAAPPYDLCANFICIVANSVPHTMTSERDSVGVSIHYFSCFTSFALYFFFFFHSFVRFIRRTFGASANLRILFSIVGRDKRTYTHHQHRNGRVRLCSGTKHFQNTESKVGTTPSAPSHAHTNEEGFFFLFIFCFLSEPISCVCIIRAIVYK